MSKKTAITWARIKKSEDGDKLADAVMEMAGRYGVVTATVLEWLRLGTIKNKDEHVLPLYREWVDANVKDSGEAYR